MKLSKLIEILEEQKAIHGDVEFVFDWGADYAPVKEEDVSITHYDHQEVYVLNFF